MLVQTNYDALACFDRIIPNLAMMVSEKFGVPHNTTQSNAQTLQNAEYRIRTALGIADAGYTHTDEHPVYGTGQGSDNSPMTWCFLLSIPFDCYATLSHHAKYCRPDRTEPMSIGMIGFVDNGNGNTICFMDDESPSTFPAIKHQLRSNAQVWTNLLGASGGALELPKCSYHLVQWHFTTEGDPVHEVHNLTSQSPCTAHKTLGHYEEPAGSQQTQFQQIWRKSKKSLAFLWKCQLTPVEIWTYYYACYYLPSVRYPLACSSLTYVQLVDRVQQKAMQIITATCGYNRHTKREIIYGP